MMTMMKTEESTTRSHWRVCAKTLCNNPPPQETFQCCFPFCMSIRRKPMWPQDRQYAITSKKEALKTDPHPPGFPEGYITGFTLIGGTQLWYLRWYRTLERNRQTKMMTFLKVWVFSPIMKIVIGMFFPPLLDKKIKQLTLKVNRSLIFRDRRLV
jgi:hypothetical protein